VCSSDLQWLESGTADSCLCHGLAGNAEILLSATDGRALAHRVVRAITIDDETPGLMTGMAGIGYFDLRMRGLATRSVLNLAAISSGA